jgi:hypothetical protein
MSRRPIAEVRVLKLPHLHPEAIRIEIECRFSTTGLTSIPGPMLALTTEQLITSAVYDHEECCGECSTEYAHSRGDQRAREMTDRAWDELVVTVQRRYDASRRN